MRTKLRRGAGLVLKFSMLMIVLVILIVAGVSVPLMWQMMRRDERTLAEGLQNRANILLESVASRAAEPIRTGASGYIAVSAFPAEISAMPDEARFLTISGPGDPERPEAPASEDPIDRDYLWATNDDDWPEGSFVPARQQFDGEILIREKVLQLAAELNADANEELKGQLEEARRLSDRLAKIPTGRGATAADKAAYEATQQQYEQVQADGRSKILELEIATKGDRTGSIPAFDPDRLEAEYLFYRPIVDFDLDGNFFAGLVRLTITTEVVRGRVNDAVKGMIGSTGVVALIAVALGVVGAILLANIAITPIGRLVKAVSAIRDTEDKSTLKEIPVGARDEIGTLAETVNEMTEGLVMAASAEKDMLVGRAIQKQFLPLEVGVGGEKGSTAGVKTADIDLYAFYEGATTVSGDYFDWQKLDDRYYAIIKCDVSGHGSPAAFIMVEVATLFLRWCRDWKARLAALPAIRDPKERERVLQELIKLDTLAYTINDMIAERGFGGRFALFMICLYDVRTGSVTACNAGDNVLYHFDVGSRAMVTREIESGNPAAGPFSSELVAAKSGYPSVQLQLKSGDVLVLFTDGFEESRRRFRDAAGAQTACIDPAHKDKKQDVLSTHKNGDTGEEMSVPRILGIFNAFFNRETYRLERHHIARAEELDFDFSSCSDSLEEAVLALVSVERVYRTYRDPQTSPKDRIILEGKVDQYLRKHFKQYELYFGKQESGDQTAEFVPISNVKEDVQEDDLTVVLLRRP